MDNMIVIALFSLLAVSAVCYETNSLRFKRAVGKKPQNVFGNCGEDLFGRKGYIASPNFPHNGYPPLSHCTWTLRVQSAFIIKFTFRYMDMEDAPVQKLSDCGADSLIIFDVETPNELIGGQRYCGHDTKFKPIFSKTNKVEINFVSDASIERNGFALQWKAVRPPRANINCDFESRNGFCFGWSQSKTDNFDWLLQQGPTPSGTFYNTGPRTDHTLGNLDGTYAYIEATSQEQGDRAILVTPTVSITSSQFFCLTFWYHMTGTGTGSLFVYRVGEGQPLLSGRVVFEAVGDQGGDWIKADIDISSGGQPVRFMFVGEIGSNFRGDIAIDDVLMMKIQCQ